ncbi:MAG: HypC/HybG/HupF family hydrogenase formation chaperone [Planctomycetes bacterium]|nr:HypC/HybG/HupF family hydrogenase formation chaperone [Planctomycetota bacterium]
MCLAVPGKIVECDEAEALVDMQGNRLKVSLALTPEAGPGDWVLVHAGFAITELDEQEALETWDYLRQAYAGPDGHLEILGGVEQSEADE